MTWNLGLIAVCTVVLTYRILSGTIFDNEMAVGPRGVVSIILMYILMYRVAITWLG